MRLSRLIALCIFAGVAAQATAPCDSLTSLAIVNVTIKSAAADPGSGVCRVKLVGTPVPDSAIGVEVWMPRPDQWNGKFLGTGNGGYSSALSTADMESGLRQGYAVAGSDTGHEGGDLKFGVGHPERIIDWGYRAIHVMTESAKLVLHAYYGHFPERAYFKGCSTGGHQALSEAQRFPADYDGIVAGAPGANRVRLNVGFLWSWLATHPKDAPPFPASKLRLLEAGGDPERLACKGADGENCLTPSEVEAVKKVYAGARNPRTGEQLFSGWARGSESGWTQYFVGKPEPARLDFWRYWVFGDPAWDPRSFDFDRDVAFADQKMAAVAAVSADLKDFQRRGGKLVLYHGMVDPVSPPGDGIAYYERVTRFMGGVSPTLGFARLFLAPGMGHCGGGPGPNTFDALAALDTWVTTGVAPSQIVATHSTAGKVDRSRPLCPYPQQAQYKGSGNVDDAASYRCQ